MLFLVVSPPLFLVPKGACHREDLAPFDLLCLERSLMHRAWRKLDRQRLPPCTLFLRHALCIPVMNTYEHIGTPEYIGQQNVIGRIILQVLIIKRWHKVLVHQTMGICFIIFTEAALIVSEGICGIYPKVSVRGSDHK